MATPFNSSRATPIATAKAFPVRADREASPAQRQNDDELVLTNRLSESRSPYVRFVGSQNISAAWS